ncbi:MAG: 16S rRNA pseudouridine(516) synthase [Zetaproteobacteria bacterium CG12_big_fil_rev_8_21_14_0_65_54_13]|nr:MAG: 16S rRNA pseudouridine(516) synthase [Zetaproteobacteria bacterium CG12_big_fil_rev_8_21_14_0_65_54_13]PIX55542.1 MAG: 16S rRNA pseudouridine(516) synthase [Zetaproteobacteria bacterium CG_4_10_14_3_um_filter_54_28]PJA27519.1 MAG: 16S rRNA pseudouridine(516) synthase [Zetaproteobacteria bacterium CG_4_9_14_3_um_filter_54_145]
MSVQEKSERLDKLLSNLGYGARKDVAHWIRAGWITVEGERATSPAQKVRASTVRLENEPLDQPNGLTIIYHKPLGAVCSRKEQGGLIYDDFPARWLDRKPPFSPVGRLDKDTSGLLIVTDDGQLNHCLTSPKKHISKTYHVTLAEPLQGAEVDIFAAGTLLLENDDRPCLPAELIIHSPTEASLTLHEGRYHQVRRMFVAAGNHVTALQRSHIGVMSLAQTGLQPGDFQITTAEALMQMIQPAAS